MYYGNANNFNILILKNFPNSIFILLVFALEIPTCIFNWTKLNFNKYLWFFPDLQETFIQYVSSNLIFDSTQHSLTIVVCQVKAGVYVTTFPASSLGASDLPLGSFSFLLYNRIAVPSVRVWWSKCSQFLLAFTNLSFLPLPLCSEDVGCCVPYLSKNELCYHLVYFFQTLAGFCSHLALLSVTKRCVKISHNDQ